MAQAIPRKYMLSKVYNVCRAGGRIHKEICILIVLATPTYVLMSGNI